MERGVFRGHLDDEQRIVFSHVLEGKSGRDIAAILGIAPSRVEHIVRKTCRQLGADGRKQAAKMIASHYMLPADRQSPVAGWSQGTVNHNGPNSFGFPTKSGRTGSVERSGKGYVHDVDSHGSFGSGAANIVSEIARFLRTDKPNKEFEYFERMLLFAVVVLSSTLALSALVATLQGFDRLIHS